jgi:hypothetical protein
MSKEYREIQRTDYSILQFVGDIGALQGTLFQVAPLLLSKIFWISFLLESHLINAIFRRRNESKNRYPRTHLEYFFSVLKNLRNSSKFKHMSRLGLRRVDRELDVVYFIRKGMAQTAILKAITTKTQRSLAYRNYRFRLGKEKRLLDEAGKPIREDPDLTTSDESSSDENFVTSSYQPKNRLDS